MVPVIKTCEEPDITPLVFNSVSIVVLIEEVNEFKLPVEVSINPNLVFCPASVVATDALKEFILVDIELLTLPKLEDKLAVVVATELDKLPILVDTEELKEPIAVPIELLKADIDPLIDELIELLNVV